MPATSTETRTTEQGRILPVETIQSFILAALSHEAAADQVDYLLYCHVAEGRDHPSVVAGSLQPIIVDLLQAPNGDDWAAIAQQLIAEAGDALGVEEDETAI